MTTAVTSAVLLDKSLQAALSAIEIYNKPDFRYREELFAILMCNSWELLLKGKTLLENKEQIDVLTVMRPVKDEATGATTQVPKLNRSGNAMTVGLEKMASVMLSQKVDGLTPEWLKNVELLIEVRDNAVHLVTGDLALSKTILEIGTASLKNYMSLAQRWFSTDFSKYNFYLMPLSFFHGFEAAKGLVLEPTTAQVAKFLEYLAATTGEAVKSESPHHVTLGIEINVVKAKGADGVAIRWTDSPTAPAMRIKEENLLERYPFDSADLAEKLKDRYSDFLQNAKFYKIKKPLDSDEKYCRVRYLDPKNPRSGSKKFYGSEVFKVFDQHYTRK